MRLKGRPRSRVGMVSSPLFWLLIGSFITVSLLGNQIRPINGQEISDDPLESFDDAAGESLDANDEQVASLDDESDEEEQAGLETDTDSAEEASVAHQVLYSTPIIDNNYLYEHFDDEAAYTTKWIKSASTKADSSEFKYDGVWGLTDSAPQLKGDKCLIMKSRARHHAIAARLDNKFKFSKDSLVLQYEVQFRNGQECGGAYMKLLSAPSGPLSQINDKSQYTIMFGPDKCGNDVKLHFIFQHKNPKNGTMREIHWKKATQVSKLDEIFKDNKWHIVRLVVNPDQTYEIDLDRKTVGKGSLLEDFNPPVNPPKEIEDPDDSKPEDWDEREKIPDPDATKPDDWDESQPRKIPDPQAKKPDDWLEDEPEMVPDPEATKPSDWDNDMDGEWEPPLVSNPKCSEVSGCGKWTAPMVDNPKYKGKWKPPMIPNPNYKGKWAPRKIPNPDFFEDLTPFNTMQPIDAAAFELWTISDGIAFDNILVTDDVDVADHIAGKTYGKKKELTDSATDNAMVKLIKYTNQHPWLWAVYVLVIGIPVVLFISFCCVTPVKKRDEDTASRKKTDEPSPDDYVPEAFGGDEPRANRPQPQPEEDEVEEQVSEEEEAEGEEAAPETQENAQNEEDVEVQPEDTPSSQLDESEGQPPRRRNRKPRKE